MAHHQDPEQTQAYQRAYYQARRDEIRTQQAAYRAAHRTEIAEQKRQAYLDNPGPARAKTQAWYKANKERAHGYNIRYREANKEALAKSAAEKRRDNSAREKQAARRKKWGQNNRDKVYEYNTRRRAAKTTSSLTFTVGQWQALLVLFDNRCAYCDAADVLLVQEHMIPLSRGGAHALENIVPSCGPCNGRKWTKTAEEFAGWTIPPRLRLLLEL